MTTEQQDAVDDERRPRPLKALQSVSVPVPSVTRVGLEVALERARELGVPGRAKAEIQPGSVARPARLKLEWQVILDVPGAVE